MGRSTRKFQSSTEIGGIVEFTGQYKVENTIWDKINKKIFHLEEQASICQGQLRGEFGYLANTPAASQVLYGAYNYPPGCDPATQDTLKECEIIRCIVPKAAVSSTFQTKSWQHR